MIEKISFVLTNHSGEEIMGDIRFSTEGGRKPVIVILHSFMAFKDCPKPARLVGSMKAGGDSFRRGWFPYVVERIAGAGYVTVIFDFSRNGVNKNLNRITEFETFRQNTVSHEIEDARVVLEAIHHGIIGNGVIDSNNIILLGHSRGGGIAIVTSAQCQDVKGLIRWSSVSTFDRWTVHQKEQWKRLGYLPLARDVSSSPLKLGLDLLLDVEKNREKLDIIRAGGILHIPWLIVHGTEDLLVRFSEVEQLYASADKTKTEFVPLEKVGHAYGGAEATESSAIHDVVDLTIHWLHKHFQ